MIGMKQWLKRLREIVGAYDPDPEILLYGSQARSDALPDSDWDFLILLGSRPSERLKNEIRHQLYEVEWDTGEVLSCIIHGRQEWNSPPLSNTPFHARVMQEAVRI